MCTFIVERDKNNLHQLERNVMVEKLYLNNLVIIQFNAIFSNDERFV